MKVQEGLDGFMKGRVRPSYTTADMISMDTVAPASARVVSPTSKMLPVPGEGHSFPEGHTELALSYEGRGIKSWWRGAASIAPRGGAVKNQAPSLLEFP